MFLRLLSTFVVGCRFLQCQKRNIRSERGRLCCLHMGRLGLRRFRLCRTEFRPADFLSAFWRFSSDSVRTRCGLCADSVPGYTINYFGRPFETQTLQKARFAVFFFRSAKGERLSESVPNLWWFRWLELIQIL